MASIRVVLLSALLALTFSLSAQQYKADRLKQAVVVTGLNIANDSLMPEKTFYAKAKDGQTVIVRVDAMGVVEHIGIPLFNEAIKLLQPSPVYDFLEYAVLNKKYTVSPNQLYLSKVIFKQGSWGSLLRERLSEASCSIENQDDKLYIVRWQRDNQDVVVLGIPIEYELLNNDTRRNMERSFVKELSAYQPSIVRPDATAVNEDELSIYGTEGLFVIPGKSYIIDILNQNVYYKLTTVYETADTIIFGNPVTMKMEAVLPVVVRDSDFPAESFANLFMCENKSVPDATIALDFHLSNYHRERYSIPLSQFRAYCRQQGCNLYFAYNGIENGLVRGVLFASNLSKGYNHLISVRMKKEDLLSENPVIQADVYMYIPPISKEKLFGTTPTKKSGAQFKLP